MKLFIGEDKYGHVTVYDGKEQYGFDEHDPRFSYKNHMSLSITFEEAVVRPADIFTAYEITKHEFGLSGLGPMVKEQEIENAPQKTRQRIW